MSTDKNTFVVILLILVQSFSFRCILGSDFDSVRIIFYFGPTYYKNQSYELHNAASILKHPKFVHKNTNLYLHGYNNTQENFSVHLMVDSYLKGNAYNFLTLDFAALVNGSYFSAQRNILELVPRISDSIFDLIDAGLDVNSFGLVGHSLGAVAIGLIGRDIHQRSNGSILLPRISLLDPSNPEAHDDFILPEIKKTDARFIDVIHSSAGQVGTSKHSGHADFWPNGGTPIQPGCPEESISKFCSHHKSFAYWAQSVAKVNSKQLLSYRAKNYETFLEYKKAIIRTRGVPMGINCPKSAYGDYYLELDSTYGENGDPSVVPK